VNTVFYIVYGDAGVTTSQEDIVNVWPANSSIWHLDEGNANQLDSKGSNDLVKAGTLADVTGIGQGISAIFNATNNLTKISASNLPTDAQSISAWYKASPNPTTLYAPTVFRRGESGVDLETSVLYVDDSSAFASGGVKIDTNYREIKDNVDIADNSWHHLVFTRNGANYKLYVDGSLENSGADGDTGNFTIAKLYAGWGGSATYDFLGTAALDELRYEALEHSANYILATYNNQNSPGTFYALGAEGGNLDKSVPDTGSGVDTLGLVKNHSIADSGVGVENLTTDWPFVADSGEGNDYLALAASISVVDVGAGLEGSSAMHASGDVGGGAPATGASPRNHPHTGKYYLAAQPWKVLFSGRITGWADQMNLTYDQGNFPGQPVTGMTLIMQSGDGWSKVRTKSAPSGASGSIVVAENDHMNWAYGTTVYILNRFELWPVHPRVVYSGGVITTYKDYDIAYTDQNENLSPIPILGPPAVAFLNAGSVSVHFSGGLSYTPDKDTWPDIISWSWSFEGGSPSVSNDMGLEVTWTTPGVYLVSLLVTNAAGKQSTGYRYVYIYDRTGANAPYTKFSIQRLTGSIAAGGWSCSVEVWEENVSQSDFPEGTQIILFAEEKWGTADVYSAGFFSGRDNIKMVGWIEGGSVAFNSETGVVSFRVVGIHALMKNCEVFSCALDYAAAPTVWTQMKGLNGIRAFQHLIYWQTTLTKIVDVWLPDMLPGAAPWTRFPAAWYIKYQDFGRATLWAQLSNLAKDVFCSMAADRFGNFYLGRSPQSVEYAHMGSISTWISLYKSDWHGDADITTRDEPVCAQYTLEGVHYDGSTATPRLSYAPGTVPAHRGKAKTYTGAVLNEQALVDALSGRLYAAENNSIPSMSLELLGNYGPSVDIAPFQWVLVTLASGDTPRGFVWNEKRFLVKRVSDSIAVTQGTSHTDISLEAYARGGTGTGGDDPPPDPPPPPPPWGDRDIEIEDSGVGTDTIYVGFPGQAASFCSTLQPANLTPIIHWIKEEADTTGTEDVPGGEKLLIGTTHTLTVTFHDSPLLEGMPILMAAMLAKGGATQYCQCGDHPPPDCDTIVYMDVYIDGDFYNWYYRIIDSCWYDGTFNICSPGAGYCPICCPPNEAMPKQRRWIADLEASLQERVRYASWRNWFTVKCVGRGDFAGSASRWVRRLSYGQSYPDSALSFVYVAGVDADTPVWIPADNDNIDLTAAAWGTAGGSINPTGKAWVRGGAYIGGLRFTNVYMDQGGQIDAAYIELTMTLTHQNFYGCNGSARLYIHEHDNSPMCDASDNPYARLVDGDCGTDYVEWDLCVNSNTYKSPDISSLLQKIASRGGWVSGQAIGFTLVPVLPKTVAGYRPVIGYPEQPWYHAWRGTISDAELVWGYGGRPSVSDSGAGVDSVSRETYTPPSWKTPDNASGAINWWHNPPYAIDSDLGTGSETEPDTGQTTGYLTFTISEITCSKVRFYGTHLYINIAVELDVYKDGAWVNIMYGAAADWAWNEKSFIEGQVTQARLRLHNNDWRYWNIHIKEFEFYGV